MISCAGEAFNGSSTTPDKVVLEQAPDALVVRGTVGMGERFPYGKISRPEKTATGFRCVLSRQHGPTSAVQTIHFANTSFFEALDKSVVASRPAPGRVAAAMGTLSIAKLLLLTIALLMLFIGLFYYALVRAYLLTPVSYDIHLGHRIDSTLSRFYEPCSSPPLDRFLTKALDRLALPADRFPHRIIVLNDTTQNAIAIPGGTIYLYRGLLEKSSSPDEVLGVLSHEMAHSEERHTVRQIIQSMGVSYLASLTIGMAIDGFDMLDGLEKTLEMSSVIFMLRYSRVFERQADSLAIVRLHHAGLRVGPLDTLLNRITPPPRLRDRLFALLLTHPRTEERSKRFQVARSFETGPVDTVFSMERAEWGMLQKKCPSPRDSTPLWKKFLRK